MRIEFHSGEKAISLYYRENVLQHAGLEDECIIEVKTKEGVKRVPLTIEQMQETHKFLSMLAMTLQMKEERGYVDRSE